QEGLDVPGAGFSSQEHLLIEADVAYLLSQVFHSKSASLLKNARLRCKTFWMFYGAYECSGWA
ncbi:MAG: hypothetical protein AAFV46_07090, partial [Cyanobacteria bacterium J06635_11]